MKPKFCILRVKMPAEDFDQETQEENGYAIFTLDADGKPETLISAMGNRVAQGELFTSIALMEDILELTRKGYELVDFPLLDRIFLDKFLLKE